MGLLKSGDKKQNEIAKEIRKDPISSYQKLATDFNSKAQRVRISLESHTAVRKPLLNTRDRQKSSVYQGYKTESRLVSRDAFPTKALQTVNKKTQSAVKKVLSKHKNPIACSECGKLMKNERGVKQHIAKMHK
ncbi:hypothetical protein BpHYR1_051480 [Brachionus plicatilis]|uniref:C2H2-type domain-containing protein n=1 Tax=Brachionus plicatilis TaxID=10195 RepID=A0A3M7S2X1_BRAPC|nr:hypothetical protein BpHYR1_051480 [Brachionus plicatilis]